MTNLRVRFDTDIVNDVYHVELELPSAALKQAVERLAPDERRVVERLSAPGMSASDKLCALSMVIRAIEDYQTVKS